MRSLTQQPPVLTVHLAAEGQYIIRVDDLARRPLVIGVTKLLADARSFVVITPADVKVFAVGESSNGVNGSSTTAAIDAMQESDAPVDAEMQAAIDEQESHTLPNAEVEAAPAPPPKATRRRPSRAPIAGHDEPCARCSGTGKTKVILDGGSGAETACPICKGEGRMIRYGARR